MLEFVSFLLLFGYNSLLYNMLVWNMEQVFLLVKIGIFGHLTLAAFPVIFFSFSFSPVAFVVPWAYALFIKQQRERSSFFGYLRAYPGPVTWALALNICALTQASYFLLSSHLPTILSTSVMCSCSTFSCYSLTQHFMKRQHNRNITRKCLFLACLILCTLVYFLCSKGQHQRKERSTLKR